MSGNTKRHTPLCSEKSDFGIKCVVYSHYKIAIRLSGVEKMTRLGTAQLCGCIASFQLSFRYKKRALPMCEPPKGTVMFMIKRCVPAGRVTTSYEAATRWDTVISASVIYSPGRTFPMLYWPLMFTRNGALLPLNSRSTFCDVNTCSRIFVHIIERLTRHLSAWHLHFSLEEKLHGVPFSASMNATFFVPGRVQRTKHLAKPKKETDFDIFIG